MSNSTVPSGLQARNRDDHSAEDAIPVSIHASSPSAVSYIDIPDVPISVEESSPPDDSPVTPSTDDSLPEPSESVLDPLGVDHDPISAARAETGAIIGSILLQPVVAASDVSVVETLDPSPDLAGDSSGSIDRSTVSIGVQTQPFIRKRGTSLLSITRLLFILRTLPIHLQTGRF